MQIYNEKEFLAIAVGNVLNFIDIKVGKLIS